MTDPHQLERENEALRDALHFEVALLRHWAAEAVARGWSMDHVKPMSERADAIDRLLERREVLSPRSSVKRNATSG
jgi:hypothetical protein